MPIRKDHVHWTDEELARLASLCQAGVGGLGTAKTLNREFHGGRVVRTERSVSLARTRHNLYVKRMHEPKAIVAVQADQEVETIQSDGATEARSVGTKIRTVEDLLAHIGADLTRFEVDRSEATKWETATADRQTGEPVITELHRVFVRLKPKLGPNATELVQAIVDGAFATRKPPTVKQKLKVQRADVLQAVVIADPHVGKYAWAQETGWQDYDVKIATQLLRESCAELLADGDQRRVGRRAIWLLGDYFHYDTPHGQTTKGTPLDRDGRVEKMIAEGTQVLFDVIEQSASSLPTDVVLVPGNHDALMTIALRQILSAYFRGDSRVTIDSRGTTRKYVTHGKNLIGLTHGDKAKKRLGELMSAEVPDLWGKSAHREWHTGHLHGEAAIDTVAGVTIRTHRALCPPDGWHAAEGYVGKARGMQAFYYHTEAGLVGMTVANPDR